MSTSRLRVYYGPESSTPAITEPESVSNTVSVPLAKVLPMLVDAVNSDRTWLRDFEDDDITISADLYEVILAYQHFRRPSA
jgi:hypothetical protein